MTKIINSILMSILVPISSATAQDAKYTFRIMNVTPNCVMISGKTMVQYDTFDETETIQWLKNDASMVVKPLMDYPLDNQRIWYKGISAKVSSEDEKGPKPDMFWWIKKNMSSSKGSPNGEEVSSWQCYRPLKPWNSIFDAEFDMYGNELIIKLPEVLKEGEGYEFVSFETGQSFGCIKEDQKPLIMITKEMLDSVGFNGKSIRLKVLYHNYYNPPKVVSESMIIRVY